MEHNQLLHVITIVDGVSEELVGVVKIEYFDLNAFVVQFDVDTKRDPQMLDRYSIGPDDARFLEAQLGRSLEFEFSRFAYFVEAARRD